MRAQKRKKEKTYVCVICKKKQKSTKKIKCCNKEMLAEKSGTWNV